VLASIWSAVLISAVWGISRRRHLRLVSIVLALPALVADWAFHVTGHRWLAACDLGAALAFLGLVTATIVAAVAGDDTTRSGHSRN
jgi:hypothetical protein